MQRIGPLLLFALAPVACSSPMPAEPGYVLQLVAPDYVEQIDPAQKHQVGDKSALQVRWFGTSCYTLELGELSLMLDPFVSNGYCFPPDFRKNRAEVDRVFEHLTPAPTAIFVNHTHNDHFLDADRALVEWEDTVLYGGRSAGNLLAGFGLQDRARDVGERSPGRVPEEGGVSGHYVRYQAFRSMHTPHFVLRDLEIAGIKVPIIDVVLTGLNGVVPEPLTEAPEFTDYQTGEVYNYLFDFCDAETDERRITVFLLGSPFSEAEPLPPEGTPIDVLIILVSSADNVEGDYPAAWIRRLNPRFMVLSHYNNFFAKRGDSGEYDTLFAADVEGFIEDLRAVAADEGVEKIYAPSVADPSREDLDTALRFPIPVGE